MQDVTKKLLTYFISGSDPYAVKHAERVAETVLAMAKLQHIDPDTDQGKAFELACLIHDVGKTGIPEFIRRLPGEYTDEERLWMRRHTLIGVEILERAGNGSIPKEVYQATRSHHENWDGSGYPDGLKGNDIPLVARYIRIADSFDAMTNVRGYRLPLTEQAAIRVMKKEQAEVQHYDPELFAVFLELYDKEPE